MTTIADPAVAATTPPPPVRPSLRAKIGSGLGYTPLIGAGFFVVLAVFGHWLAPDNADAVDFAHRLRPPSGAHWFGTDEAGRDVFSRVLDGAHVTLGSVAIVVGVSAIFGVLVGAIAGLLGGFVDNLLMRLTDLGLAIPGLVLALGLAAAMGSSLRSAVIAVTVTWWPRFARLVRAILVEVKNLDYVRAARELGASPTRIMFRHLLPATVDTVMVQVTISIGTAALAISSLSFIGVGAQPPQSEWGAMIADSQGYLPATWWAPVFPGLALTLTALCFSFSGDWLAARRAIGPISRFTKPTADAHAL